jgi:molybdopterin molybdotransferase
VLFWKIAMRPGRPMAIGRLGKAWLFGLPGNPVAVMVNFYEFPRGVLFQEEGQWRVKLSGNQGSGVLRSMADANCFIVLPEDSGSVAAGELVEVQPFEGLL